MRRLATLALFAAALAALPAAPQTGAGAAAPDKAKQLLDQMFAALGGEKYLTVRDLTRRGRLYAFDRGELASPGDRFVNFVKFPGKERHEEGKKGNIIYLYAGEQGWELDRQGIREMSPEQIANFHQANRRDIEYLLRFRLQQEKFQFYYLGSEFIDNRRLHLLELVDSGQESYVLYLDAQTSLPAQLRSRPRDAATGERVEEVEHYGKYFPVDGIAAYKVMSRERAGKKSLEVFIDEVQYNTGVSESLFSRASLEERWKKVKD